MEHCPKPLSQKIRLSPESFEKCEALRYRGGAKHLLTACHVVCFAILFGAFVELRKWLQPKKPLCNGYHPTKTSSAMRPLCQGKPKSPSIFHNSLTLTDVDAVTKRKLISHQVKYFIPEFNCNRVISTTIARLRTRYFKWMKISPDGFYFMVLTPSKH
ncbi:hypothetical protein TNCV_4704991 [Trichonephila clavipes]|nr:hypothetical protein TNCV_4704991 [Trichonephila clavipes]